MLAEPEYLLGWLLSGDEWLLLLYALVLHHIVVGFVKEYVC